MHWTSIAPDIKDIIDIMPLFDHFDFLAPHYDRFIKPKEPDVLIKLLDMPADGPLLDAGGGTGRVSQTLRNYFPEILIADASLNMLRQANNKDGLKTICSHTEKLPFPGGYFERIIMVDALHHVHNQRETAMELWRVLKPGGKVIIEEPDSRKFTVKLIALAEKLALMRSHFLKPHQIASLFPVDTSDIEIHSDEFNAWVVVNKIIV